MGVLGKCKGEGEADETAPSTKFKSTKDHALVKIKYDAKSCNKLIRNFFLLD